jgi:hypothetical protein
MRYWLCMYLLLTQHPLNNVPSAAITGLTLQQRMNLSACSHGWFFCCLYELLTSQILSCLHALYLSSLPHANFQHLPSN